MASIFKLPDLGEGIHEAEIMSVKVKVGDTVQEGDMLLEVETDKAIAEIPSPVTGEISVIHVRPGDLVNVGDPLITFDQQADDRDRAEEKPMPVETVSKGVHPDTLQEEQKPSTSGRTIVPASPATRRLARELGVDLSLVTPSGPGGLVTASDVTESVAQQKKYAEHGQPAAIKKETDSSIPSGTTDVPDLPDFSKWGSVRRERLNAVRRAISRQMTLSWSQIPHVNSQENADITELEKVRNEYKSKIEKQGAKLTLSAFVLKAVTTALKKYPRFNASLDPASEEMIFKEYYHIGIAVDTPDGLIVPVIKDVDRKSIAEVAVELTNLVQRTRNRKTKLDEMQGGTFTLTNAGSMGGGSFAPIINYPEVAILGLGRAEWQPVAREISFGKRDIAIRFVLPLILSIDHRVLDGADAIKFLLTIKAALEDPQELMMTMV